MPTHEKIAFWLSPSAGAHEFFEALIKQLAERYEAPTFEPHVTLCSAALPDARATEILRNLSIRENIELEVQGIEFSEKYTKTLFVQFRSTPAIEALNRELKKAAQSDDELNPHLSLLYKEMPHEAKADAARSVSLPFTTVTFDAVKAVLTPTPIKGPEEITVWRNIASRRLDTAAE